MQQLVVIDYRAMQNSNTAMDLRDRVMPPDLKQFDEAIRKSGLNDNHDVDELAFALFRTGTSSDDLETVGIAQGQFDVQDIMANFRKQKMQAKLVRTNSVYPLAHTGMVLCFRRSFNHGLRKQGGSKGRAGCARRICAGNADQRPMMDAMQIGRLGASVEHSRQKRHRRP